MHLIKSWVLLCSLTLCFSYAGFSQKIHYTVGFENAAHHEARISVEVTGAKAEVLTFRMSRSSPGRYATHEFGKNVYDVSASDGTKALPVKKTDADVYQVSGNKGKVILTYTLFANHADGTYAGIDPTSIHLNMPAVFMWVKGLEKSPITIAFRVPDTSFTVATQLKPGSGKFTFSAPDLQYFLDSPVKIGMLKWREWAASGNGPSGKIRLALEAEATTQQVDSLADMIQRITSQAKVIFKEFPAYDYGTYTFISSMTPYVYGDGMEHRNSTMITLPFEFGLVPDAIEVFAHEFFHCWNVERIRPKTLEPFNFEKSNLSDELWFAEGFTQYYGALLMKRTGLEDEQDFIETVSRIINTKLNAPGATLYTPIQASNMAVFTDAGVSIDKTNYANIFTSYYTYGAAIALALDLQLRSRFNKSLDLFMQQVWMNHGKKEIPYTIPDLRKALGQVSSVPFANSFFDKHIYGKEAPDYKALLAAAGFELVPTAAGQPWIGNANFSDHPSGALITGGTLRNWPLYEAGLDADDVITKVNDTPVKSGADLVALVRSKRAGDRLNLEYLHRGMMKQTVLTVKENPGVKLQSLQSSGKSATPEQLTFRNKWLGAQ